MSLGGAFCVLGSLPCMLGGRGLPCMLGLSHSIASVQRNNRPHSYLFGFSRAILIPFNSSKTTLFRKSNDYASKPLSFIGGGFIGE